MTKAHKPEENQETQNEKGTNKAPEKDENLVTMVKDGTKLEVHASCVTAHTDKGWKLC